MDHHPALWDMPKKKRAVHGLIFYFYFIFRFGLFLGGLGGGLWVVLRAWDFPTEGVLPRTPFNY